MLPSLGGTPSQTILHRYSIIRVSCGLAAALNYLAQPIGLTPVPDNETYPGGGAIAIFDGARST